MRNPKNRYGVPRFANVAEYDGGETLLRKYIYGAGVDEPICMIDVADSNAVYYYHFDGLRSVVALSDSAGDTVQVYEYSVFGRVAASDPNHTNPFLFTGRRFDAETGLYYYRARYYNPHIGRFLQTDPIGYADGSNLYNYCGNSPVVFSDAYGLWQITVGGAIGLGVRVTVGYNYGRTSIDFAGGYGLGWTFEGTGQSVLPGPASQGLAANVGVEASAGATVGSVDVGGAVRGRAEADAAGNTETRVGGTGGITIPLTPVDLGMSADVVAGGEFGDVDQGEFYVGGDVSVDPPSVGFGLMAFAGVTGGIAWGEVKPPVEPKVKRPVEPKVKPPVQPNKSGK